MKRLARVVVPLWFLIAAVVASPARAGDYPPPRDEDKPAAQVVGKWEPVFVGAIDRVNEWNRHMIGVMTNFHRGRVEKRLQMLMSSSGPMLSGDVVKLNERGHMWFGGGLAFSAESDFANVATAGAYICGGLQGTRPYGANGFAEIRLMGMGSGPRMYLALGARLVQ